MKQLTFTFVLLLATFMTIFAQQEEAQNKALIPIPIDDGGGVDFDWAFSGSNIYRYSGNVGIGTSSPAYKLDVVGDIRTSAWLRSSGDYGLYNSSDGTYFYSDDLYYFKMRSDRGLRIANKANATKGYLYHDNGSSFGLLDADAQWSLRMVRDSWTSFNINNSEKMRILSSGNIGIGTTAPSQKLDVNGNARVRGNLQLNSAGYIDDDGTFGGNSDDWIRLNGYVEAKSNTDNYGVLIRDKDQNGYVAITEKDNVAYFSENTSSGSYFMKADGRNTTFGGRVTGTRAGFSGTYNSTQVQGIWSIGSGFTIDQTANTFGTQYGLVYAHTNSSKGISGWGHQIMHVNNGAMKSSVSMTYGHAYFAGNVGIGETSPSHKLDVAGTINATEYLLNGQPLSTGGGVDGITSVNGNIGIGTSETHGYKLAVAGNIITEEVKVQLQTAWPDYVFTPEYELASLEEVKQHIVEKGHLPNVPSASEVEEQGIQLGEMSATLLEKIEELTLYMIQLKEENKDLIDRIENLENR